MQPPGNHSERSTRQTLDEGYLSLSAPVSRPLIPRTSTPSHYYCLGTLDLGLCQCKTTKVPIYSTAARSAPLLLYRCYGDCGHLVVPALRARSVSITITRLLVVEDKLDATPDCACCAALFVICR